MEITFKLFATLGDYLPPGARYNQIPLNVGDGATIGEVIEPFNLPPQLVHLVLVNGVFIPAEQRQSHVLKEGDALAIWPPIAGG